MGLEDYLRGAYAADKRQLQLIGEIVGQVVPAFYRFWDSGAQSWPYEVSAAATPEVVALSQSTHCMVLFMLEALDAVHDGSVLMPTAQHPFDLNAAGVDLSELGKVR